MTLAGLQKEIVRRLGPHGAKVGTVEDDLKAVLFDLSGKGDFILTSDTITTADGTAGYALATYCENAKSIIGVSITEGDWLDLATFKDYQKYIENTSSPSESEPERYCVHNGTLYLFDGVPDQAYTATVFYSKFHDDSTTIEFSDDFREAIIAGTIAMVWETKLNDQDGWADKAAYWRAKYLAEVVEQRMNRRGQPRITKYKDV